MLIPPITKNRFVRFFSSSVINQTLLFVGFLLRFKFYWQNRSFGLDEQYLALETSIRNFTEILTATNIDGVLPVAPVGFMFLEKWLVHALGYQELVFRGVPFICGAGSVFIFYAFLKKFASKETIPIALALFVLSEPLIYQSAEFKQYSVEVFAVLCLYLTMKWSISQEKDKRRPFFIMYAVGLVSICFTYAAVFVLMSISMTQICLSYRNKDRRNLRRWLLILISWGIAFFVIHGPAFVLMTRHNPTILGRAESYFMPYPIWSLKSLLWTCSSLLNIFISPAGLAFPAICLGLFIMGGFYIYWKRKSDYFVLALPLLFSFLAAAAHKYPFTGRFLLYMTPAIFLFVATGIAWIIKMDKIVYRIVGCALLLMLFSNPIRNSYEYLMQSDYKENGNRAIVGHLRQDLMPGDRVFFNNSGYYGLCFYMGRGLYDKNSCNLIRLSDKVFFVNDDPYIYKQDVFLQYASNRFVSGVRVINQGEPVFKNQDNGLGNNSRTWFLFMSTEAGLKEFVLELAARQGVLRDGIQRGQSFLYLYDLSGG